MRESNESQIRVLHVTQMHPAGALEDDGETDDEATWHKPTIKSQYEILRFFWDKPDAIIFLEGQFEPWTQVDKKRMFEVDPGLPYVRRAFTSDRLPALEELSKQQRALLAFSLAPRILLVLGRIKALYPTTTLAEDREFAFEMQALIKKYGSSFGALVSPERKRVEKIHYEDREHRALAQIVGFSKKENFEGRTVYLVYGAAHNFRRWRKRFPVQVTRLSMVEGWWRQAVVHVALVSIYCMATWYYRLRGYMPKLLFGTENRKIN